MLVAALVSIRKVRGPQSVVVMHLKLLLKAENLDESNSNMRGMKRVGFKVLLEHLDLKRNMIQ